MLAKFSVKKPFTIVVMVVLILVFGYVAFSKMTPELFPDIELPYAMVVTSYVGATPEEVEKEVSKPLEEQIATIDNIKNVYSYSNENSSMVMLEFNSGTNMDTVSSDIREKIDLISGQWDESVSNPIIMKLNPNMIPVTVAAVDMKGKSNVELSAFVEDTLSRKLEGTEGVAKVSTTGLIEESVQVALDQKKIDKINKKMSAAIVSQFSGAKSEISSGIGSANSSKGTLAVGKNKIINAQKDLAVKTEAARIKLTKSREQLVALRNSAAVLTQLNEAVNNAEKQNAAIKKSVRAANPGKSEKEIEEICMKDPTYANNAVILARADQTLKSMGMKRSDLPGAVKQLATVNKQIKAIDKALSNLNVQTSVGTSSLSNSMSEITAGNAALQATVMQLQSSLAQIQSQEEAALNSANMTGVITMDNVSSILKAQNFSMPAGYVSEDDQDVLVSVGDKIKDTDELSNLVILDMGLKGVSAVKLKDVAAVTKIDTGDETYAKINGKDGVLLTFSKRSGFATAQVAENITDKFAELEKDNDGLKFNVLSDQGEYIKIVINSVLENLLIGAILAIIILLLFLRDIRPTVITAFSIPISVTFAIVLMYFSGVTLNVVSLAGLAVGVGMLVDNSIVVIENIYRLRGLGYSVKEAAISGASQMAGAITASTLTTICVFAPIVFVDGLTRQIFQDMALTVAYSLLASLFIALTLVPAMARGMLKKTRQKAILDVNSKPIRKYVSILEYALDHKKLFIIGSIVLLLGSGAAVFLKGFTYMPGMGSTEMSVNITLPDKNTLKETETTCDKVVDKLLKIDGVKTAGVMLADDANTIMMSGASGSGDKDYSKVTVYGLLEQNAADQSKEIGEELKKECKSLDCELDIMSEMSMSSAMGTAGISINVYSDDLHKLRETGTAIEKKMKKLRETENVSDSDEKSVSELKVTVDKNKAMNRGFTVAQVYADLSTALTKEKVSTSIVDDGKDKDVLVLNKDNNELSPDDIKGLVLTTTDSRGNQKTAKLADIADIGTGKTLDTIERYNQRRVLRVQSDVKDDYNITKTTSKIKDMVDNMDIPKGVTVEFEGENEDIMDALSQLVTMLLLGILMVYLVMVAQFQSLLSPLIVMFTIPLAFTGGFLALLIAGYEVSVVSMMGFIMLTGVIVNNAIVLIDCINRLRSEGMEMREAVVAAGTVRMRPILMTALTTILALIPVAIGFGSGGEMIQPVAIVCIGGLIYATLMTLIVIPLFYDGMKRGHSKGFKSLKKQKT